ncbi:MAG: hypothetical protein Q9184_007479 [Pyrenodesmia sp. 2 TL-2023]
MQQADVRKQINKNNQEGHLAVFNLYQDLYGHEHKAIENEIAKAGSGASLVSLKRTTSNFWHRDISFKGVPGLQFVLEHMVQWTSHSRDAQHSAHKTVEPASSTTEQTPNEGRCKEQRLADLFNDRSTPDLPLGHVEYYEEAQEQSKEDLSILKGLVLNKQGQREGAGKILGRCELVPDNERKANPVGPFAGPQRKEVNRPPPSSTGYNAACGQSESQYAAPVSTHDNKNALNLQAADSEMRGEPIAEFTGPTRLPESVKHSLSRPGIHLQTTSEVGEEKGKRNAGASYRFRQRREEKERNSELQWQTTNPKPLPVGEAQHPTRGQYNNVPNDLKAKPASAVDKGKILKPEVTYMPSGPGSVTQEDYNQGYSSRRRRRASTSTAGEEACKVGRDSDRPQASDKDKSGGGDEQEQQVARPLRHKPKMTQPRARCYAVRDFAPAPSYPSSYDELDSKVLTRDSALDEPGEEYAAAQAEAKQSAAAKIDQEASSVENSGDIKHKYFDRGRKRTKTGCLSRSSQHSPLNMAINLFLACRRRRIKCGEERPTCGNCVKSKTNCEGYAPRFIFRDPLGTDLPSVGVAYDSGSNFQPIATHDGFDAQHQQLQPRNVSQMSLPAIAPHIRTPPQIMQERRDREARRTIRIEAATAAEAGFPDRSRSPGSTGGDSYIPPMTKDEGYLAAPPPRSPGALSADNEARSPGVFEYPGINIDGGTTGDDDPFVGREKHARHLSGYSHEMPSPLYDGATGRGIGTEEIDEPEEPIKSSPQKEAQEPYGAYSAYISDTSYARAVRSFSRNFSTTHLSKKDEAIEVAVEVPASTAEEPQEWLPSIESRKRRTGAGDPQKKCASCHTRVTPEWRRGPSGNRSLCNSCGLRWAEKVRSWNSGSSNRQEGVGIVFTDSRGNDENIAEVPEEQFEESWQTKSKKGKKGLKAKAAEAETEQDIIGNPASVARPTAPTSVESGAGRAGTDGIFYPPYPRQAARRASHHHHRAKAGKISKGLKLPASIPASMNEDHNSAKEETGRRRERARTVTIPTSLSKSDGDGVEKTGIGYTVFTSLHGAGMKSSTSHKEGADQGFLKDSSLRKEDVEISKTNMATNDPKESADTNTDDEEEDEQDYPEQELPEQEFLEFPVTLAADMNERGFPEEGADQGFISFGRDGEIPKTNIATNNPESADTDDDDDEEAVEDDVMDEAEAERVVRDLLEKYTTLFATPTQEREADIQNT